MIEFPVNAQFKRTMPKDLRAIHEANDSEAWGYARGWLDSWPTYVGRGADPKQVGSSLVLSGPPGVGKTMLASAMLNEIEASHKKSVAFITDDQLDRMLRRARFTRMDDEDEHLQALIEGAGFLVVDDALRLGGTAEYLEPFLRLRFARGKSTILTLNSDVPIAAALDSFLSTWTWAVFTGPDQRRV